MPSLDRSKQDKQSASFLFEETVEEGQGTTRRTRRISVRIVAVGVVLIAAEVILVLMAR
jgi:hypothetical protein